MVDLGLRPARAGPKEHTAAAAPAGFAEPRRKATRVRLWRVVPASESAAVSPRVARGSRARGPPFARREGNGEGESEGECSACLVVRRSAATDRGVAPPCNGCARAVKRE